jgi:hypothetical protein
MTANPDILPEPPKTPLISAAEASRLVVTVALTLAGTAAGLAGLVVLADRPAWWRGLAAAAVASALASGVSLLPLVWGLRHSLQGAVAGYFIAMGLRAGVSLGACLVAVYAGRYPQAPTFLMMVAFYFAVLAVESVWVARVTWRTGAPSGPGVTAGQRRN